MDTLSRPGRLAAVLALLALAARPAAAARPWIDAGRCRITIVAAADILAMDPDARGNRERAPLGWAVADLADYLEKISGVRPAVDAAPRPGTVPVRVRLKNEGEDIGETSELGDAYLLAIGADGAELVGETPHATAYAVYHLLHELGVRWYGPEEWNEVVPRLDTVSPAPGRRAFTPDYPSRALWGVCRRWLLRNRMGGTRMPEGHAFRRFMQGMEPRDAAPLVERHPELYPVVDGRIRAHQANLSHPEVFRRAARYVREAFARNPDALGVTLGPDDGALRDERPATRALMSGRPDPLFPQRQDSTDLLVGFLNRVAAEIEAEHPDKLLGFYVYSNHQAVPEIAPHPMLYPKIAPINFSRYTSIGAPHAPTSMMLRDIMQAWVELSPRVGYYLYNFNLADCAMPFTRVAAFRRDIPNLHRWGLRYATIESGANWHTMMPGNYMIGRLFWDIDTDVDALLEEFYRLYYGPAAAAMREYDRVLEDAYENTSAYTGNLWSMYRILTPAVRRRLAGHLARAERAAAAAGSDIYAYRVGLPRVSLRLAEAWAAARDHLQRFNFPAAGAAGRSFLAAWEDGRSRYPGRRRASDFFSPSIERYWRIFHQPTFLAAEKIAAEGTLLLRLPDTWKGWLDPTAIGESLGLADPRSPKDHWPDLNTYSQTIDHQGFPHFRGLLWYATDIRTPRFTLDEEEEVFLWFGGNDSNTRVFIDGHFAGEFRTANFQPGEVAVTPWLRPGTVQHLVVAVDNRPVYELGTGGIMRPAVLYRRALAAGEEPARLREVADPDAGPLFTVE